jgi:hypothetical protein
LARRRALVAAVAALATVASVLAGAGVVRSGVADTTLTLDTATVTASWKESWLTGSVAFSGTVSAQAELTVFLRRVNPAPTVVAAKKTLTAGPGGYSGTLSLPPRARPGDYVLRVVGTSGGVKLAPAETPVTVPAPPEGVIDKASVSVTQGGKSVRRVKGPVKQLFARFHFIVPPEVRSAVRLVWRTPQFNFVGEVRKPYSTTMDTFIKSGSPLPKGTWYCLLQVNEVVVKRVAVRVT